MQENEAIKTKSIMAWLNNLNNQSKTFFILLHIWNSVQQNYSCDTFSNFPGQAKEK